MDMITGLLHPKGAPRFVEQIDKKRAVAKEERDCRAKVDARDKRRCFFPCCKAYANEKHHITSRSVRGKTIWCSDDILSACTEHHRMFKAGLIWTKGNPDRGPVKVFATALGKAAGIRIP
jgi:hypothetical protein